MSLHLHGSNFLVLPFQDYLYRTVSGWSQFWLCFLPEPVPKFPRYRKYDVRIRLSYRLAENATKTANEQKNAKQQQQQQNTQSLSLPVHRRLCDKIHGTVRNFFAPLCSSLCSVLPEPPPLGDTCTTTYDSILQRTAQYYSLLQSTPPYYKVLESLSPYDKILVCSWNFYKAPLHITNYYKVLICTSKCYKLPSVLQDIGPYYKVVLRNTKYY